MENRRLRVFFEMFHDAIIVVLSLIVSVMALRRPFGFEFLLQRVFWYGALPAACAFVFCGYVLHTYSVIWRFPTGSDYLRLIVSSGMSVGAFTVCALLTSFGSGNLNLSTAVILAFVLISCFTMLLRWRWHLQALKMHEDEKTEPKEKISSVISGNIMVVGAGSAGSQFIREVSSKHIRGMSVRCAIDDDSKKIGQYIHSVPIYGNRRKISEAVEKYKISSIVFAIPNCSTENKAEIMHICQGTKCKLYTMPSISQILSENFSAVSAVREVQIEDLLGRAPVSINVESVMNYVKDRVVLVTGGGGSIGSELCRQLAVHEPKQLIIFDVYENSAYDIQNELKHDYPELNLVTLIGSVRDSKRLNCIFGKYHPEIVYHAAAHKHVPLMEDSPNETIKNNVFGTYKTALAAAENGVSKFILISTDKAVNPTNIMGASKRICEMIVQTFNEKYDTDFVAVRFGNVLGSNGSVIPLFKKQIADGGPVTVTDPNIIRYFMTIPEAVSLVLQAGATAKGGEIFVLDMGEPVRILDLAENLIRLSGYEPYKDINIQFTGLRPGEKLFEEMLMSEEGLKRTDNDLIYIGCPIKIDADLLNQTLAEMKKAMYDDSADVRALVQRIVPTYHYVTMNGFVKP